MGVTGAPQWLTASPIQLVATHTACAVSDGDEPQGPPLPSLHVTAPLFQAGRRLCPGSSVLGTPSLWPDVGGVESVPSELSFKPILFPPKNIYVSYA